MHPSIDVDDIVEGYMGLNLELDNLKENLGMPDVLGASWFDRGVICIDSSLKGKDGRFAFTVAHEIGHWRLHRPLVEAQKLTLPLFTRKPGEPKQPGIVCRSSKKDNTEYQADYFAAQLLMPAKAVRLAAHKAFDGKVPAIDGLLESKQHRTLRSALRSLADRVRDAGKFSNVSNEPMCYRLMDLNLVEDTKEAQSRLF